MANNIEKIVADLIEDKLEKSGITLVEVELKKENKSRLLRIFIDTPNGVNLDNCTAASRLIKDILDVNEDKLDYDYLEVSSPGIDRILKTDKDLEQHISYRIRIKTNEVIDGRKKFTGYLKSFNNEQLIIEFDSEIFSIPREIISQIRLNPEI